MAFEFGSLSAARARRALRTIADADYMVLRIVAIELDLEPGDSESMDFLADALKEAARKIERAAADERQSALAARDGGAKA